MLRSHASIALSSFKPIPDEEGTETPYRIYLSREEFTLQTDPR